MTSITKEETPAFWRAKQAARGSGGGGSPITADRKTVWSFQWLVQRPYSTIHGGNARGQIENASENGETT